MVFFLTPCWWGNEGREPLPLRLPPLQQRAGAGESIRALADYLGQSDPGFTLRVYTHLMPASEDRARSAVDAAFGPARAQHMSKAGF